MTENPSKSTTSNIPAEPKVIWALYDDFGFYEGFKNKEDAVAISKNYYNPSRPNHKPQVVKMVEEQ